MSAIVSGQFDTHSVLCMFSVFVMNLYSLHYIVVLYLLC